MLTNVAFGIQIAVATVLLWFFAIPFVNVVEAIAHVLNSFAVWIVA
jgi:hypothetical protein